MAASDTHTTHHHHFRAFVRAIPPSVCTMNPFENLQPVEVMRERQVQFQLDCQDGKGNAYACHSVAEFHAVVDNDHAKAAEVLKKNCDGKNNYPASCFKLGRLLLSGKGMEKSDQLALKRFEKACDSGYSQACYHLGSMLVEGAEVKKDEEKAVRVFDRACRDGDPNSCHWLGQRFLAQGERRDPPRAAQSLTVACDGGHAPSCRLLAVLFRNGDTGVEKDEQKYLNFRSRTEELVKQRGSMMGVRVT